jgi:hypothetical protein
LKKQCLIKPVMLVGLNSGCKQKQGRGVGERLAVSYPSPPSGVDHLPVSPLSLGEVFRVPIVSSGERVRVREIFSLCLPASLSAVA